MSIAKTIEITAQSREGFDQAIRDGITTASKTVKNIKQAWVKDQNVEVKNDSIELYRVTLKVTFVLQ